MTEPYTLAEEIPELDRPVLLYHFAGFMDAGGAGRLATEHLLATSNPRPVARFELDDLVDYRSRRPLMIFDTDRWVEYRAPEMVVHACEDGAGVPFLVMTGPEPDLAWERFAASVIALAGHFGVRLSVGVHGIPMAVPHTRDTELTPHGNRPDLFGEHPHRISRAEVPGSAAALLEFRLAESGHDVIGFAAHIPHYLSQSDYPAGAIALLAGITAATGLAFSVDGLQESATRTRAQVDEQVSASAEIAEAVRDLETRYDAVAAASDSSLPLAGPGARMPDGDEIAAEFERFLAEREE